MLENIGWKQKVLAAVVGVNLVLAIAVSAGAVSRPGDGDVQTANVAQIDEIEAPAARQPGDSAEVAQQGVAPPTTVATPPTTIPAPKPTAPPTTKAPAPKATTPTTKVPASATAAASAPAAATTAAATKVPRRVPTAAEVQAAIAELKRQVGGLLLLVSPTPAQIDQVGDQVCTAFDNGQTFAQVRATALSMIPATITVPLATTDWAVRQAVTLYCPGHASKLA